ncbi:MAG: hypothetical protein H0T59_02120 [Chloroflexi bacterium]|nr:hypothetical protein [Chloroflexota bacterium]
MPVFEPVAGLRVIADPAALDAARWDGMEVTVLRFAPDDAFAIGAGAVDLDDEHAIVEPEVGFVAARLPLDVVERHVEWSLPTERPAFAQGSVAAVPAKLWIEAGDGGHDDEVLLLTAAAYARDLAERLR